MPKWIKFLIAILLLPVCFGVSRVLWSLVVHSGSAERVWVPILAGGMAWFVVFLLLPKPMWIYVFGHELTHAVWTWLFGGRVKRFKATSKGGQVVVTKTNFVIALAPYFFPFYTILITVLYVIGDLIWDWSAQQVWFHVLLGMTYAFHLTLTWHVLKTQQTDITEHGYFFSGVIIFLGNVSVLLIALPLLMKTRPLLLVLGDVLTATGHVFRKLSGIF